MNDKLELLKIKSERVLVGDMELVLKTSTLMQQKALATAMAQINPGPLFAAVQPIIAAAGTDGFASALAQHGPVAYQALMDLLANAGGDAVASAAGAVLDNGENFRALRDANLIDDADCNRDGRRYLNSDQLRRVIVETITPRQAMNVITTVLRLNDYTALGEVLAALATQAVGAATGLMTGSDKPASASSAGSLLNGSTT